MCGGGEDAQRFVSEDRIMKEVGIFFVGCLPCRTCLSPEAGERDFEG